MRYRLVVLFFACLLATTAYSQQSSQPSSQAPAGQGSSATPQSKTDDRTAAEKAADAAKSVKPPDYSQESFVIEQMHSRYRFEADGTGRKEVIARIRVQSEAGVQQWG